MEIIVGTKFKTMHHKHPKKMEVIDILKTYNSKDELVKTVYLCEHELAGQKVLSEECKTTILRGLNK